LSIDRKPQILQNLNLVRERIKSAALAANKDPGDINLIAVTKNFPIPDLLTLYEAGVRDFGENRDQEAREKVAQLPSDIRWHFQGQIQSNKLKSITQWATYVHSVDQFRYAKMISDFTEGANRSIFIQISLDNQVKVDEESQTRGGVNPDTLLQLADEITQLPKVNLLGVMAVAPLNGSVTEAFSQMAQFSSILVKSHPQARALSIGMSGDFEEGIKHGATHLRIGTSILGNR
jgi:pyridoxal phosphate enzyme (YggS family)